MAAAGVLTFLDSHCEVNTEWLQPMLQRVKEVSVSSLGELCPSGRAHCVLSMRAYEGSLELGRQSTKPKWFVPS